MNQKKPTQLERVSDACLAFRLDNHYISDNSYLFIAPDSDFCRACFKRRYTTQMMSDIKTAHLHNNVLNLAIKLDDNHNKNGLWQVFSLADQQPLMSFEFASYEDCPTCGTIDYCSRTEAGKHYNTLLTQETTPKLDELKNQIFSFGFARSSITTKEIGLENSKWDELLGNNYEARILFRMISPDGRHADDSAMGFSKSKELAELKSLMEYLERYAFMMQLCRFKTKKFNDEIIFKSLALYRKSVSTNERKQIRSMASWGINLHTKEICAIPLSFLYNKGKVRFITPTSSGFGAHTNFNKSLCSSILELIERDAYIRFWHNPRFAFNFTPDTNVQSAVDDIISILAPVVDNDSLVSKFYILKSPTKLPVVLATISSQDFSKAPSLNFGCGIGFDINEALNGALEELRLNAVNLVKGISVIDGFLTRVFTEKVESIPDRMNFYSTSAPRKKLKFLDNDNPLINGVIIETKQPDLNALIDRFKQVNFDIYGIDCTPHCFRDKNVYVTRAFSPHLYPLQFEQENVFKISTDPLSSHEALPHFFL